MMYGFTRMWQHAQKLPVLATALTLLSVVVFNVGAYGQGAPPVLPDHTVYGRLGTGTGSGPAQAIPFATISGLISNSLIIGTTAVGSGVNGQFLYNNSGILGNAALGTMSTQNANNVAVTGGTITGLPSPSIAADAANKGYVDAVAVGLTIHTQVSWATAAVLPNTPNYNNGTAGVGATLTASSNTAIVVDGGSPSSSDRVLVKNQVTGAQNGVYTVTTVGDGSHAWVLTRATDFNTATAGNMAEGAYFFVGEGITNTASSWVFVTTGALTIGTTALSFSQFASSGSGPWAISGSNIYYNAGNVGIGTASPATALSVNGSITTNITGSIQCLQVNSSGVINGTNASCVPQTVNTPQQFDASCGTAGHDCTSGINSCLATLICFLPCGTYDTGTGFALTGSRNSLDFRGSGYCSIVRGTVNGIVVLAIGDGSNAIQHGVVANMRIISSVSAANTCLQGQLFNMVTFKDLWLDSNCFNAVVIVGPQQTSLENVQILNCSGTGIIAYATSLTAQFTTDMNTAVSGCSASGMGLRGNIGGAELNNLTLLNGQNGLFFDNASGGARNLQVFLGPFFDSDTNAGNGVLTSADSYSQLFCQGCWSSSNTGAGFALVGAQPGGVGGVGAVEIGGAAGIVANLSAAGQINVTSTPIKLTVAGGVIIDSDPNGAAIALTGSAASLVLINGIIMTNNKAPVFVSGTAPVYLSVVGNIESGNTSGNTVSAGALLCSMNNGSNVTGFTSTTGGC